MFELIAEDWCRRKYLISLITKEYMIILKLELLQDMRFARNIHDTTNVNLNIILNLFILNHETKVILNTSQ